MTTQGGDRMRRTVRQRTRRMAGRVCGHCDQPADVMLRWGRQSIPICRRCKDHLDAGQASPEDVHRWRSLGGVGPWCPVDEGRPCGDCILPGGDGASGTPEDDVPADTEPKERRGLMGRLFQRAKE